jgi:hypothetical protein
MNHRIVITIDTAEEIECGEVMKFITQALAEKIDESTQISVVDFGLQTAETYESVCDKRVADLQSQLADAL